MSKTSIKIFINSIYKIKEQYKINYRVNKLPSYLHMTLRGLILSVGNLEKSTKKGTVRLSLIFGLKNSFYSLHLYNLFEPYINTPPNVLSVYNKKQIVVVF
jgi:hypothetical protein